MLKNVQAQTTSCPAAVSMAAAEGALTGVQSGVESLRLGIQNHRDVMLQELRAFEGVRVEPPQGTFYCLPDFRALSNDSEELSRFLLDKALVVTVPGKEFGAEGHLRLSYCGSTKDVIEGVAPDALGARPDGAERHRDRRPPAREGLAVTANPLDLKTPAQGRARELASDYGLENHGVTNPRCVYWNLPAEALYEELVFRGEGRIVRGGAVAVDTGQATPRARRWTSSSSASPRREDRIWWGEYNRPLGSDTFELLLARMLGFLQERDLFVQDLHACAQPEYRLPIRIVTELRLAQPLRPQHVPEAGEPRGVPPARPRAHDPLRAVLRGAPADRRHADRLVHRARLRAEALPDRRHRSTRAS